jgi:integrase
VGGPAIDEARLVALIEAAAEQNWRAGAWLLERAHPSRWAAGASTLSPGTRKGRARPEHDLRHSFCSLAGRRGVDPIEAAQITGHSPAVWARFYARSFGKAQRDEARRRMLEHGFGDAR